MLRASALQRRLQEDPFAKLLALFGFGRFWFAAVRPGSDALRGGIGSAVRPDAVSVMSDAVEMVPTGRRTGSPFEAVGRSGLTSLLCRSSPVGELRRD
jgi:hypothetical protein